MADVPTSGPGALRGAIDLSGLAKHNPEQDSSEGVPVPALVFDATDASFGDVVELSRQVPVLVELSSSREQAGDQLSTLLRTVVLSLAGKFVLARVDADVSSQVFAAFGVQTTPTVCALIAGQPVPLFTGLLPEQQLRAVLEQLLQVAAQNGVSSSARATEEQSEPEETAEKPLPPHHQEAYDAIARQDYAAAVAEYQTAIAQDPSDQLAVAGLAQASLLQRLQGRTVDQIRQAAAEDPSSLDAQFSVADLDLSGGHVDDAFGRLLELFPGLDQEARTRVRKRLLDYFEIVGAADPRVAHARRRLSNLLY